MIILEYVRSFAVEEVDASIMKQVELILILKIVAGYILVIDKKIEELNKQANDLSLHQAESLAKWHASKHHSEQIGSIFYNQNNQIVQYISNLYSERDEIHQHKMKWFLVIEIARAKLNMSNEKLFSLMSMFELTINVDIEISILKKFINVLERQEEYENCQLISTKIQELKSVA